MTPVVYVIMPVGSDPAYERRRATIEEAAAALGLATLLPADRQHADVPFDLEHARRDLRRARVVLADLTLERPSCYYEVGLAQALNRRVVLVAERGTPIHQAHDRDKVIFYDSLDDLSAKLTRVLRPIATAPRTRTRAAAKTP
ncbi:hypothetical protein RB614_22485 [Phytohabitans sp. ZYX-F-186]|uniref:Nucleoside 2-deoxyribosyltransferase n=1 Tax=Phytohabitans maris TaxID=3071409 RepID=A0ABU0ZJQ1_9ACTN|nr:hypothetical protein [Phytohabitans sp. ZYX-F-186]MDQ7907287.1 hypothetical protein [Phytohabitans sp. ZYX-F-186]